ncbi:1311_t:CDS:2 [Rhizophagus irregularis]|nr:1311_t:CDS:2 [Rhizophagus irregularis]
MTNVKSGLDTLWNKNPGILFLISGDSDYLLIVNQALEMSSSMRQKEDNSTISFYPDVRDYD